MILVDNQAEETLADAKKMLAQNISSRSVINRAYYSMFYVLLALYIARRRYGTTFIASQEMGSSCH